MKSSFVTVGSAALACGLLLQGCMLDATEGASSDPETTSSDRDALIANGYVQIPGALVHRSCIYEIDDGDVVEPAQSVIVRSGGALDHVPPCPHPAVRTGVSTEALVEPSSQDQAPTTSGWKEAGYFHTSKVVAEIKAKWVVPPAPKTKSDQLIYLFPGIQNGIRILQPVLQYGNNGAWGGHRWTMASWSCDDGDNCYHSTPKRTYAGHTISGIVAGYDCTDKCSKWTITTTDATAGRTTTLNTGKNFRIYHDVFGGALEAYDVTTCGQYPGNSMTKFYDIGVFDKNYDPIAQSWQGLLWSSTPTGCAFGVTSSSVNHWVALHY